MKLKRLASTLAAAAIAGGGAVTMSAVTAAPAQADGGSDWSGWGAGSARSFCVAKAHKKIIKKRGGGQFGRYFGHSRRLVVKKVATKYVRCGSSHRRHHRFGKGFGHHGFGDKGFGHKGFGDKGFGHKGFGDKGFGDWGHKGW